MSAHKDGPWQWIRARTMFHLHSARGYFGISLRAGSDTKDVRHLIAAAPELRDALVLIRDFNGRDYFDGGLSSIKSIARAAIAKATKETP